MKYESDYSSEEHSQLQQQNSQESSLSIQEEHSNSQQHQQKLLQLKLQQENIKTQLKKLPYGLILKQKQQLFQQKAKIQQRQFNSKKKKIKKIIQKNQDKYAPKELPIHKKPKKKLDKIIFQPKRPKTVDPRFQNYTGTYNKDLAMKSFDFIPKIQQQQINHIQKRLHSKSKKDRLSQHQRQVLLTQYNKLTSERKKVQIDGLKHKVLIDIRKQRTNKKFQGNSNKYIYHPKKSQFKERLQKQKMSRMSEQQRKKHLVKKNKQLQKNQASQRSNFIYQSTIRGKKERY